jgi:hypothetical protein
VISNGINEVLLVDSYKSQDLIKFKENQKALLHQYLMLGLFHK